MKKLAGVLFAAAILCRAGAAELNWLTDVDKAKAQAKADKKLVMLDFTGSDWCGWCIKLNKEVFSQPEFAKYAKDNLVLVEVDFPHEKRQTEEVKKANQALLEKYKVEGFPTIIVLNANGEKVGEAEYMDNPKAFIAKMEEIKKKS